MDKDPAMEQEFATESTTRSKVAVTIAAAALLAAAVAGCSHGPVATPKTLTAKGRVAFVAQGKPGDVLFVSRLDGSGQRRVRVPGTHGRVQIGTPVFSPDGSRFAFLARSSRIDRAYVAAAAGQWVRALPIAPRLLTHTGGLAWSHDARLLAFCSTQDDDVGLFLVRANGRGLRKLPALPLGTAPPGGHPDGIGAISWSPADDRLAFGVAYTFDDPGPATTKIATIGLADAAASTVATTGPLGDLVWLVDGRTLAFTQWSNGITGSLATVDLASGVTREPLKDSVDWSSPLLFTTRGLVVKWFDDRARAARLALVGNRGKHVRDLWKIARYSDDPDPLGLMGGPLSAEEVYPVAISRDGRRVALERFEPHALRVVSLGGRTLLARRLHAPKGHRLGDVVIFLK
jgi:hypothetical protein